MGRVRRTVLVELELRGFVDSQFRLVVGGICAGMKPQGLAGLLVFEDG